MCADVRYRDREMVALDARQDDDASTSAPAPRRAARRDAAIGLLYRRIQNAQLSRLFAAFKMPLLVYVIATVMSTAAAQSVAEWSAEEFRRAAAQPVYRSRPSAYQQRQTADWSRDAAPPPSSIVEPASDDNQPRPRAFGATNYEAQPLSEHNNPYISPDINRPTAPPRLPSFGGPNPLNPYVDVPGQFSNWPPQVPQPNIVNRPASNHDQVPFSYNRDQSAGGQSDDSAATPPQVSYYLPNQQSVQPNVEYGSQNADNHEANKKPPVLLIGNFPPFGGPGGPQAPPQTFPYIPPPATGAPPPPQQSGGFNYAPPNPPLHRPNVVAPPAATPNDYGNPQPPPYNPYSNQPQPSPHRAVPLPVPPPQNQDYNPQPTPVYPSQNQDETGYEGPGGPTPTGPGGPIPSGPGGPTPSGPGTPTPGGPGGPTPSGPGSPTPGGPGGPPSEVPSRPTPGGPIPPPGRPGGPASRVPGGPTPGGHGGPTPGVPTPGGPGGPTSGGPGVPPPAFPTPEFHGSPPPGGPTPGFSGAPPPGGPGGPTPGFPGAPPPGGPPPSGPGGPPPRGPTPGFPTPGFPGAPPPRVPPSNIPEGPPPGGPTPSGPGGPPPGGPTPGFPSAPPPGGPGGPTPRFPGAPSPGGPTPSGPGGPPPGGPTPGFPTPGFPGAPPPRVPPSNIPGVPSPGGPGGPPPGGPTPGFPGAPPPGGPGGLTPHLPGAPPTGGPGGPPPSGPSPGGPGGPTPGFPGAPPPGGPTPGGPGGSPPEGPRGPPTQFPGAPPPANRFTPPTFPPQFPTLITTPPPVHIPPREEFPPNFPTRSTPGFPSFKIPGFPTPGGPRGLTPGFPTPGGPGGPPPFERPGFPTPGGPGGLTPGFPTRGGPRGPSPGGPGGPPPFERPGVPTPGGPGGPPPFERPGVPTPGGPGGPPPFARPGFPTPGGPRGPPPGFPTPSGPGGPPPFERPGFPTPSETPPPRFPPQERPPPGGPPQPGFPSTGGPPPGFQTLPPPGPPQTTAPPEHMVPNKIRGKARVVCEESGMQFTVNTIFPFTGQIFAHDRKRVPNCVHAFNEATNVSVSFSYAECGIRNAGNDSRAHEQFHLQIIVQFEQPDHTTTVQSFIVQCAEQKLQYNKQTIPKRIEEALEELRLVPTQLEQKAPVPDCLLRIVTDVEHHKPGDGVDVDEVDVGQPLRVELSLQPESDAYGFLVRNCVVRDMISGMQHEVIDSRGCSTDLNIFAHPHYDTYHDVARVHWHAFKLPDHTRLSLTCQFDICLDIADANGDKSCASIPTPPFCADIVTSPSNSILFDATGFARSKRSVASDSENVVQKTVTIEFNTTTAEPTTHGVPEAEEVDEQKAMDHLPALFPSAAARQSPKALTLTQSVHAGICLGAKAGASGDAKSKDDYCSSKQFETDRFKHLEKIASEPRQAEILLPTSAPSSCASGWPLVVVLVSAASVALLVLAALLNVGMRLRRRLRSIKMTINEHH